jgi:hypothetical protein
MEILLSPSGMSAMIIASFLIAPWVIMFAKVFRRH